VATRYCGVLSSHARLRSQVVPQAPTEATATEESEKPARKSKYIPWAKLLRRTFLVDVLECPKCKGRMKILWEDVQVLVRPYSAVGAQVEQAAHSPCHMSAPVVLCQNSIGASSSLVSTKNPSNASTRFRAMCSSHAAENCNGSGSMSRSAWFSASS